MKRSKRLFILLGILIVVCVATFAVMHAEEEKEQIKNSGETVLEIPAGDVQALSWKYGETSLAFHKDEKWLYDEDDAFPVDEDKINSLLEQFEAFSVSFIIEEVTDYSMYGLDEPVCTIHLQTGEQSYDIQLGNFSNMDEERYISLGDGNVYLAKQDPLDQFEVTLRNLIRQDASLSYRQVSNIEFSGSENYSIFYEEESPETYCTDDVYFTADEEKILPLDSGRVRSYLDGLTTLDLTNYVTYNVTEEELESFGLDEPELTVTVDYTTEDENGEEISGAYVLSVSRDPEELAAAAEAEEESDAEEVTAYARVGDSQIVYQISEYSYNSLMAASYNDLRHREVLTAAFEDVQQIDILLEDTAYTLSFAAADTEDAEDETQTWKYGEEEIDIAEFQTALENLCAGSKDSFTDEQPAEKEEISLTFYLNNENHPKVEIALYRYDGSDCLAVIDGQPFALVSRSDTMDLVEAVNAIVLN